MELKMKRIFYFLIIIILSNFTIYSAQQNDRQNRQTNQGQNAQAGQQGNQEQGQNNQQADTERRVIPSDPSSLKREYYRDLKLNTDMTVKLVGKLNENQILNSNSFLVVTYLAPKKIKSIAFYGKDKKLALYVLNKRLNMFFYYITFDYTDDLVNTMVLRDPSDQKFWKITFEYDNRKNITKSEIYRRETETGELKKVFVNKYKYYNQGKLFLHTRLNEEDRLEEKTYYTPGGKKKRYERYSVDGKKMQYYIVYFYQGNEEQRREVYSESDVLIEIIDMRRQGNNVSQALNNR